MQAAGGRSTRAQLPVRSLHLACFFFDWMEDGVRVLLWGVGQGNGNDLVCFAAKNRKSLRSFLQADGQTSSITTISFGAGMMRSMPKRTRGIFFHGQRILTGVFIWVAQSAMSADVLPPEVARQMDPYILSGTRPRIAFIRREDIFGLRDNPTLEADFVRLDLEPSELTTVERRILDAWLRSGSNRLLLKSDDMVKYSGLMGLEGTYRERGLWKLTLGDHPVNTDCQEVQVDKAMARVPPDAIVVATAAGYPAAGSFTFGQTTVFFTDDPRGSDLRRWYLNFMHWALGLKVPGAAEVRLRGRQATTLADAARHDSVILKNGDALAGFILNSTFEIETPYAALKLPRQHLERVVFKGSNQPVDVVHLRSGDVVSGTVRSQQLSIELIDGETISLEMDAVHELNFHARM